VNKKVIFIALVLSGFMSLILYKSLDKDPAPQTALPQIPTAPAEKKIPVVKYIGDRNLPAFTFLDEESISKKFVIEQVPESALGKNDEERSRFVGSFEEMKDRYLAVTVVPGDRLTRERLSEPNVIPNLASAIRPGMRAVSIMVSQSSSVGGFVQQGDYVDVVATLRPAGEETITKILLQNIKILAVGGSYVRDPNVATFAPAIAAAKMNIVTLEVTPSDLEKLLFIESGADFRLILKNPKEAKDTLGSPIMTPGANQRRVLADLGYRKDPVSGTFTAPEDIEAQQAQTTVQTPGLEEKMRMQREYDDGKVEIVFGSARRRQIYKYGGPGAEKFKNLPDKAGTDEVFGGYGSLPEASYIDMPR